MGDDPSRRLSSSQRPSATPGRSCKAATPDRGLASRRRHRERAGSGRSGWARPGTAHGRAGCDARAVARRPNRRPARYEPAGDDMQHGLDLPPRVADCIDADAPSWRRGPARSSGCSTSTSSARRALPLVPAAGALAVHHGEHRAPRGDQARRDGAGDVGGNWCEESRAADAHHGQPGDLRRRGTRRPTRGPVPMPTPRHTEDGGAPDAG